MTDHQFRPAPKDHEIEVLFDGKAHKGRYHLEHDNIVVTYQGASKLAHQGTDNDRLAREILAEIVSAKHGKH
jgi:hypothetical protein